MLLLLDHRQFFVFGVPLTSTEGAPVGEAPRSEFSSGAPAAIAFLSEHYIPSLKKEPLYL